jgi:excisionase family DNA binding protein
LGACVRGFSAMVLMQALHDKLPQTIRELERNPNAHPDYARELRATWADLQMAGQAFLAWREVVPSVASAEVPERLVGSDSGCVSPPRDTGWVAARLNRSERWVRMLIASGRLAATKQGGRWLVDPASVEIYLEAEKEAA